MMNRTLSLLFVGIIGSFLPIIADVTFTVNVPTGTKYCYVVGGLPELSSWAAGAAVSMDKVAGKDQFTVTIPSITTADVAASEGYKYICGPDWKYVEVTASDGEVSNRKTVGNPDVVARWRNTYCPVGIVENWTIAGKEHPIQILLPTNYDKTKQYPVTYMFGRHQRYRDAGSDTEMGDRILYSDSWGVAETVAELEQRGEEPGIIVVIYAQLPEFTPWANKDFAGTGKADAFLKGFVEDFKPAFEQKYAISSNNSACTIMGADVAGLFAFYATIKHPHLFGRCVMFSPAFWYNQKELRNFIGQLTPTHTSTYFLFVETSADSNWITDEITYYENWINNNVSFAHVYKREGEHDDRTWGTMFATTLFDIPIELPTTEAAIRHRKCYCC